MYSACALFDIIYIQTNTNHAEILINGRIRLVDKMILTKEALFCSKKSLVKSLHWYKLDLLTSSYTT